MKKLKNKTFYICSFLLYFILMSAAVIMSYVYLEPNIKSFFISTFAASKKGAENIAEIVVDDTSSLRYPLPWPNYMYAEILDYFTTYAKPKVIGLDIFLPPINPMSKGDIDFVNQIKKSDNLVLSFVPVIGNSSFAPEEQKVYDYFVNTQSLKVNKYVESFYTKYNKIAVLQDEYYGAVKHFGSVVVDKDKVTERVFAYNNLVKVGDKYYPSMPLKMYLLENDTNEVVIDDDNIIVPKTGVKIPHDLISDGLVRTNIRYNDSFVKEYGDKHSTHYNCPAYRIIDSYRHLKAGKPEKDDIDPELFKDKIVFIGVNISGESADVHRTPMSDRHPGVSIQATMYDNIANNFFIRYAGFFEHLIVLFLISLLTFVFVFRLNFIKSLLYIILTDICYFIICAAAAWNGYMISFIMPIAAQLITLIFGYSFKFISENRNKEKIKQAMGKYLSQDIMKNVVSNIDDLKLGGKRAIVTVLFSDIRGFTALSEKLSAEEVSLILNEYFSEMEPIITKYNGVINKFIGDAVLAIFGEPIQDINHAQNAVKCAYEMLKKVEYLREKWLYEGKPEIEIGVGINTGEVFIGNIGTETRMEYTVIGDTVNLASRIESYNKVYKTNLLVSSSTYSHITDIADVIKISEVQIRGKTKKMNIYEVLRIERNK